MTAAVDARDVFRIHRTAEGDAAALQGLTLRIDTQEVVAVLGPSGSGKSTLMRILAGLERPSAGSARVLGHDLTALPARRSAVLRAQRMGVVDQHYRQALPPDLDCASIVTLQMAMLGAPRADCTRRSAELLERVGLAEAATARPSELSVARLSASPSARRWPTARPCSWPTSRPASSTPPACRRRTR